MAIILHLLVALLPACWASSPIEKLFWDVGEDDSFYSTEFHRMVQTDNFMRHGKLVFGDWSATQTFDMGKRYRRPIPKTEATTLQATVESLNQSHYHFSAVNKVNDRVCNISINGPQIMTNFIREYRREKGNVEFMKDVVSVDFNLYGVNIELEYFQLFNKTREGVFKFLPYRIKDFTNLYRFTNRPASSQLFSHKFEVDATEGCLQDAALDRIRENNTNSTNCWNGTLCFFRVESDMEIEVSHMFMFAMTYTYAWFNMIQTGFFNMDLQVCAVKANEKTNDFRRSYKPYTIYECCSTSKAHRYPYESLSDNELFCHKPYQVTEILAIISLFLSYFTMAVFPLAITWLPSPHSTDHPNVR